MSPKTQAYASTRQKSEIRTNATTLTQHVDAHIRISSPAADAVIPIGLGARALERSSLEISTGTHQQPGERSKAAGTTISPAIEKDIKTSQDRIIRRQAKQRKPHLPGWAHQAVAEEGSKSATSVTPAPRQRPSQPRPSEQRPRHPRPGDSADNALVLD